MQQEVPPAARALLAAAQQQNSGEPRVFTGEPITLDFQGADLRAVLRTFAEISQGLNIIIDPSIQGTVDVSLRDVPWDQALDIILRANKLGYSVEGNIVRIVPLNVLATENEERRKLQEAQSLAGELRVLTRAISYAKAIDLVPVITRSALSARGDVQVDNRTNTLIIRDLADRLVAAGDLITTLDRPQPQVEIEARIVQLDRNKSRDLGIRVESHRSCRPGTGHQHGAGVPEPRHPHRRHRRRRSGVAEQHRHRPWVGQRRDRPERAPARAGERRHDQGAVDAAHHDAEQHRGRNHAGPADSPAGRVEQHRHGDVQGRGAELARHAADHRLANRDHEHHGGKRHARLLGDVAAQPIPAINTQRAVTTVLMADGDTTVIGGIFTKLESQSQQRTPFLHRVPLLGWLFKTDTRNAGRLGVVDLHHAPDWEIGTS